MKSLWIGGRACEAASKKTREVCDPASGAVLETVPEGGREKVEAAVAAAAGAFPAWAALPANDRATLLHEVATRMRDHQATLIELLTREQGKPVSENEEEIEWSANTFDCYAELGRHEVGQVLPPGGIGHTSCVLTQRPSMGVMLNL